MRRLLDNTCGVRGRLYRRGTVIPLVAVSLTVLVSFAALAIDVGRVYTTRAELQRTADAVAMATAAELSTSGEGDPLTRARAVAADYAARNQVLGAGITLDPSTDIIFGQAQMDAVTKKYTFTPTELTPNAVRVRARRTQDSPNGPVPTILAGVFGVNSTSVSAEATAVLTPRDIVFVMDLSGSHCYDSMLRHAQMPGIGSISNKQVWEHLFDTDHYPGQQVEGQGPTIGNMRVWGDDTVSPGWNCETDAGFVRLKRGENFGLSKAWLSQTLSEKGYGTYTDAEVAAINKVGLSETSYSNTTQRANYRRRVLVALGIYRWKSGKSGGQAGGNGDDYIDSTEVETMIPFPNSTDNPATKCRKICGASGSTSAATWDNWVDYVASSNLSDSNTNSLPYYQRYVDNGNPDSSYYGDPNLRWRFGLKSFVDFPLDYSNLKYLSNACSPGLIGSAEQPMGAVAAAVQESIRIIEGLEGNDRISSVAYDTVGRGPAEKPSNLSYLTDQFSVVSTKVASLQAGMWGTSTNIADGIDRGRSVLFDTSHGAREEAAKIMILLTDGNANRRRSSGTRGDDACEDAVIAAQETHVYQGRKVYIYAVSVGAGANRELMESIARVGVGLPPTPAVGDPELHMHASGSVENYSVQLQQIFRQLGGKRPVVLVN